MGFANQFDNQPKDFKHGDTLDNYEIDIVFIRFGHGGNGYSSAKVRMVGGGTQKSFFETMLSAIDFH